jgi:hypothetical protein
MKILITGIACFIGFHLFWKCIDATDSVVTKSIPDNEVYAGISAKLIKTTYEYSIGIKRRSLGLGHLKGKEKDDTLKMFQL